MPQFAADRCPGEVLGGEPVGRFAAGPAFFRVQEQIFKGCGQRGGVARVDDAARLAIGHQMGQGAHACDHGGHLLRESFEHDDAEGFVAARQAQDGRLGDERGHAFEGDEAQDFDLRVRNLRRSPGDAQPRSGQAGGELGEGGEQLGTALAFPIDPDEENGLIAIFVVV